MLRQLLTLLAVFTGLAAACEPARASAAGVEQVRLEAGAQAAAAHVARAGVVQGYHAGVEKAAGAEPTWRQFRLPVPVPTVMIGADRARE